MTSRILIDPERRIVYTRAVNPLTIEQVKNHRERLRKDSRFDPNFHQILSFEDVRDIQLTSGELRVLAAANVFTGSSRRAFIIPMDALFGMGRMFASYREMAGEPNITVVRSLIDAAEWVGVEFAAAQRALQALQSNVASTLES